jgi:cholesterol transport system auxiliary component
VHAPTVRPMFDTPQMAYTRQVQQIAYFRDHQWAETPGQMLHPLLVDALRASGAFAAVVRPPHTAASAHALRVELVELLQDFSVQPPVLRLALRVEVVDPAGRVLAARDVVAREPMAESNAVGGIAAANRAAARVVRESVEFVLATTAR